MPHQFTLWLRRPLSFSGTVHLQFRNADSGKAVAAWQSSRDAGYIGPHAGAGQWGASAP